MTRMGFKRDEHKKEKAAMEKHATVGLLTMRD